MSERPYQINPSDTRIEVVDDIVQDFGGWHVKSGVALRHIDEPEQLDIMHKFTASPEFNKRLSSAQRELALRSFIACEQGKTWEYHYRADDEEGLFAATVPDIVKPAELIDGLVLSGALGWYNDEYSDLGDWSSDKGIPLFETYRLAGAASLMPRLSLHDMGSYSHTHNNITTTQYIGADMHGDFRARRVVAASGSVISPTGETVEYAPLLEHKEAAAYHSSEMTIMSVMLAQLLNNASEEERRSIKQTLLARVSGERDPSTILFADFGDETSLVNKYVQRYKRSRVRTGNELAELIVGPDSRDQRTLSIVSGEAALELVTYLYSKEIDRLEVPNEEVSDFIAALCAAKQGRVSVRSLRALIVSF